MRCQITHVAGGWAGDLDLDKKLRLQAHLQCNPHHNGIVWRMRAASLKQHHCCCLGFG